MHVSKSVNVVTGAYNTETWASTHTTNGTVERKGVQLLLP